MSKSNAVAPLNPLSAALRPNPTLSHAIRLLSTWSGSDKLFMLTQYTSIIAATLLRRRAVALDGKVSALSAADRFQTLSRMCSESRMLYRLWGLLPIWQWAISLANPETQPQDKRLLVIERLQAISMLFYYPLEHLYFFSAKGLLPLGPSRTLQVALWSSRAWAVYVTLQLVHLTERFGVLSDSLRRLKLRARAIDAGQVGREITGEKDLDDGVEGEREGETDDEKRELVERDEVRSELRTLLTRKSAMINETMINAAYFPLTLHWSLAEGIYKNELITGVCGTIAAIGQIRAGWRATA